MSDPAEENQRPEIELLRQIQIRKRFLENGATAWTTVHRSWHNSDNEGAKFAAFAPRSYRPIAIGKPNWDLSIGGGLPGFVQSYAGGRKRTRYLRFGNSPGIEPIVIIQEHHGGKPNSLPQVAEEFRLYHNLWVSPDGGQLIKVEDDGTEYVAAEISLDEVRIRTKLLRQFQAGRQLNLLLFIDSVQYVPALARDDSIDYDALTERIEQPDGNLEFHASAGTRVTQSGPFSRLLAKRVIEPPVRKFAGRWPYDEQDEHFPEFIIGEDENGREIRHTCDPDKLANYFGANPDSAHYLTPVFFRRDVLLKYYEEPEKYSIDDGYLSCAHLWGLHIDNDHPEYVMVFLGDLGRDLPSSERDHWRSANVAPTGAMSDTSFRRAFLSQVTEPQAPDLRFKQLFRKFREDWKKRFGWDLFRDPVSADEHVLKRLRIPLNESQPEFEGQMLNMAKVLVDSLNEAKLEELLGSKVKDEKGIAKLKRWLEQAGYPDIDGVIDLLQQIQRLRSRAAAHRKGSDYDEFVKKELGNDGSVWGVARLLARAADMLISLRQFFL
jgi:hypothetical protein